MGEPILEVLEVLLGGRIYGKPAEASQESTDGRKGMEVDRKKSFGRVKKAKFNKKGLLAG